MTLLEQRALGRPVLVLVLACLGGCSPNGPPVSTRTQLVIETASASLPRGAVGTVYFFTLSASGGTTPYTWALVQGSQPPGLSFDPATATLSGTPTSSVSSDSLTFTVTDSGGPSQTASVTLALTIAPAPLVITTSSMPAGMVGQAYSATLAASGGTGPYAWMLTSGTLSGGLTLDASSGAITGTPTASASGVQLAFKVTDSGSPSQTASVTLALTIAPAPLVVTTSSLPAGKVGQAYSAMLAASGGTTPYSWTRTGGALPAGLSLSPPGVISGTPTAPVNATPLTFKVTDSGSPTQSASVSVTLTIGAGTTVTVAVSPARAALTVTQKLTVVATTSDPAGVTWSVSPGGSGGSFNPASSVSGANVAFTAPSSGGVYTVTATSVTNTTVSASFTAGVTDLAGVYTWHHDLARDGANTHEYALTSANVGTSTFGKLFSCTVDGAVYAQPLWMANLTVNGAMHNVVFVATEHDSLFAFDADATSCVQLWQVSLIGTNHGGTAGEVTVPDGTSGYLVGSGLGDITPEVGVTGTPVIDPTTHTLYVVSKSVSAAGTTFYQRLHAVDITTGNERTGSPVAISATFPGAGDGGSTVTFSPRQQNQRAGLALVNGTIYIAWGSHEDNPPYYGWIIGYTYNGSSFRQSAVLNVTPNLGSGGIWMTGGAPSADSNNHLYVITANGDFDVTNSSGPTNDYGDSFLQLGGNLTVLSYFTPSDQASDSANDMDFGSGGSAVVLNVTSGAPQHLLVGGGKDGTLYLLNGDNMGGYGDTKARQHFSLGNAIFSTSAFWNDTLYVAPTGGRLSAFALNTATYLLNTTPASESSATFGWPGATPSISASGPGSDGIVWALDTHNYCTNQSSGCGPAVLHAYDAGNLGSELWNSSMLGADAAGYAVKFTVPTIANGKVYVGDRGNNTGGGYASTSASGQLDVYGLKPN